MERYRRRLLVVAAGGGLLLGAWTLACDGSGPAPSPQPAVTPSPSPTAPVGPTATPSVPPADPANPGDQEALVPSFPGAQPALDLEGEPRLAAPGVDPGDYKSLFRAGYLASATPFDVMGFYRFTLGEAPYGWETFSVSGSGLLYRGVFTKQDGRYAAWVIAFTPAAGDEPTRIIIDVGERADSTDGQAGDGS